MERITKAMVSANHMRIFAKRVNANASKNIEDSSKLV